MLKETRDELIRLSELCEANLNNFVGEVNDELTRHQITETIRQYISDVGKITPLVFELDKIGVEVVLRSGVYPWEHKHDAIVPNEYTQRLFNEIIGNIS